MAEDLEVNCAELKFHYRELVGASEQFYDSLARSLKSKNFSQPHGLKEEVEARIKDTRERLRFPEFLEEFNRQASNLLRKGYPQAVGVSEYLFLLYIQPLKEKLRELASRRFEEGRIPFVLVVKKEMVNLEKMISLTGIEGESGASYLESDVLNEFVPADGIEIPSSNIYLMIDVRKKDTSTADARAGNSLAKIIKEERFPLTLEEGIALLTHHPEILKERNILLAGSKHRLGITPVFWRDELGPRLGVYAELEENGFYPSCQNRLGI